MKHNKYLLSILFTLTLTMVLLVCAVLRLVFPLLILPQWNIPNLVLMSLVPLLIRCYAGASGNQSYLSLFLLSAASCALLPWAVGWAAPTQAVCNGLSGSVVFTATAWLFDSMTDRLSSSPAGKLAPLMGGFGLYLASQCFQGILL